MPGSYRVPIVLSTPYSPTREKPKQIISKAKKPLLSSHIHAGGGASDLDDEEDHQGNLLIDKSMTKLMRANLSTNQDHVEESADFPRPQPIVAAAVGVTSFTSR